MQASFRCFVFDERAYLSNAIYQKQEKNVNIHISEQN